MKYETTLANWGNSTALRIPQEILKSLHFEANSTVELRVHRGSLVITPKRQKPTLASLLHGLTPATRTDLIEFGDYFEELDYGW